MRILVFAVLASTALLLAGCRPSNASLSDSEHRELVEQWRDGRVQRLKAEDGFLNLAGLFWLQPGRHTFGSDDSHPIRFPEKVAATVGTFEVTDEGVVMEVAAGVDVMIDGQTVSKQLLAPDTAEYPDTATLGSLAWVVIEREGRFAVRLRDFENPAIEALAPFDYFPISGEYRVQGQLQRYAEPKTVMVDTVIEGLGWQPESPGVVEFELDGQALQLEAYASSEGRLFFVFGDLTNRDATYPAGRFLYADPPDDAGRVVLDFNQSYSPPCAFNEFSTCPVATPRNRLKLAVAAGEKYQRGDY